MTTPIDYDALLARLRDGFGTAMGRPAQVDAYHAICREAIEAIRALRAALHDAESGELKNALAVGQVCIELNEERRANEALRAEAVESERDAARYRWMRDSQGPHIAGQLRYAANQRGAAFDRHIDAAMAAQEKANG